MLIKSEYNLIMNHKKVLRLMKKYNLLSIIRKKKPYSKIIKATKEHRTCNNILNRNFSWLDAFKKLWTDISYLYYNWTKAYISILKDMITWEIISHQLSRSLEMPFVLKTIESFDIRKITWAIIQSDQWVHYTHPWYQKLLKNNWIIQSMSRKWNCLDNAPTESFFWHMKDEIDLSWIKSYKKLVKYIDNYIFYYNYNRPQWSRKKMTPVQYRNHLLNS
jgi:transposase InsO family protein